MADTLTDQQGAAPGPQDGPTLEDLARRYQETRADADFNALADRCHNLVFFMVRRVSLRWPGVAPDPDDAVAASRAGLLLAAQRYRPDRGAGFLTFACACMRGQVGGLYRKEARATRHMTSLDAAFGDDATLLDTLADPAAEAPEASPARQEMADRLQALIDRHCRREEAALLRLYFWDGWTLRQIGEHIGRSYEIARRTIKAGLRRLRAAIADPQTLELAMPVSDLATMDWGNEVNRMIRDLLERDGTLPPGFEQWLRGRIERRMASQPAGRG